VRGKESRPQWRRSKGLNAHRDIAHRTTGEPTGAPAIAAKKAVKSKPKAKTEPSTDTEAENHIDADGSDDISTDTGQTVGDSPTKKPEDTGRHSTSPDDRLEVSRQMFNCKERS